jgi:3-dehydroquinate dehydratase/shikimate dehydrogenase
MLVFDTVYNPESTLLVKDGRSRNCAVITGVEMFVRQAMLQFWLFTRKEAPAELMRDVLKGAIGPLKYSPPPPPTELEVDLPSVESD